MNGAWLLPLLIAITGTLDSADLRMAPGFIGEFPVPLLAVFPISYREVGWIMMKLELLGGVLHLPLLAGPVLIAAWSWDALSYRLAGTILIKSAGVFLAGLPLPPVFLLSRRSNDSHQAGCLTVLLLGLIVLAGGGGIVGVFMIPDPRGVLAALGVVAACGWFVYGAHGWAWARGRFDWIGPTGEWD